MMKKNLPFIVGLFFVTLVAASLHSQFKTDPEKEIEFLQNEDKTEAALFSDKGKISTQRVSSGFNSAGSNNAGSNSNAATCLNLCQARIIEVLALEQTLTSEDITLISDNAMAFAKILASKPTELASLLRKLQGDEGGDDNAHLAAYEVSLLLSDEERISAGQALLVHGNPGYRIVGVKLVSEAVTRDKEAAQALNALVNRESNAHVLINLLNTLSADNNERVHHPETVYTLDTLIGHQSSDYIRGSALIAKSKLVEYPANAKADVSQALRSSSNTFREYGLKAYAIMKERQFLNDNTAALGHDDQELQSLINKMIDDPDLDSESRTLALRLIRDF